ncbi:unnamed protein product [Durusdinium trenchii]|uniref:Uncharacterized protein n=1 Tax=Durusdinium trenchii TaxID=1381693 RepID=A0ABP0NR43_9DINO|eukprot:g8740.t1
MLVLRPMVFELRWSGASPCPTLEARPVPQVGDGPRAPPSLSSAVALSSGHASSLALCGRWSFFWENVWAQAPGPRALWPFRVALVFFFERGEPLPEPRLGGRHVLGTCVRRP